MNQSNENPALEMPRYKCHKVVWALHIGGVVINHNGSAVLTPSDKRFAEIKVDAGYVKKHEPGPGGYYVVYEDNYKSFSPAKAFEEGYAPLGAEPPPPPEVPVDGCAPAQGGQSGESAANTAEPVAIDFSEAFVGRR